MNEIKSAAFVFMLFDHAARAFSLEPSMAGRIAFPLFAVVFLSSPPTPRRILRLLICGVFAQPAYSYVFESPALNVLFTFAAADALRLLWTERKTAFRTSPFSGASASKILDIATFVAGSVFVLSFSVLCEYGPVFVTAASVFSGAGPVLAGVSAAYLANLPDVESAAWTLAAAAFFVLEQTGGPSRPYPIRGASFYFLYVFHLHVLAILKFVYST